MANYCDLNSLFFKQFFGIHFTIITAQFVRLKNFFADTY